MEVFLLLKKNLKYIKSKSDMLEEDFYKIYKRETVNVYKHTGLWQCIDTKRDLDYLENLLKK